MRTALALLTLVVPAALPAPARAVINPGLQPVDLCERHDNVLICEITAVDTDKNCFTMKVTKALKGNLKADSSITVAAGDDMKSLLATQFKDGSLRAGVRLAVFAGKSQRKTRQNDMLFYYAGGWGVGEMSAGGQWTWAGNDRQEEGIAVAGEQAGAVSTLGGTWNGSTARLTELLEDIFAGKAYLPRKAYVRFREELPLLDMGGAGRGVALYDIDGDGKLDIYACGDAGDQVLLQTKPEPGADGTLPPVGFVAAGEYLGLEGVAGPSCSFADVNGDGLPDLLAGDTIYLASDRTKGRFTRTDMLPRIPGAKLKCAAFVDFSGDGWPDVVASYEGLGLHAYLNPGRGGGKFIDLTRQMGLARKECGAGLTGFFDAGDWNGDGRTDLFYGAGPGLLLVMGDRGAFRVVRHTANLAFESDGDRMPGLTGAACFANILGLERPDLMVPMESSWALLANDKGVPRDVTAVGGEISEASFAMLATIADDFNLDGYVDFFTVARGDAGQNRLLLNRGYGTFMHADPHRYYDAVFPSGIVDAGGWGMASGDVDGDGAPDLVITNGRGELVLVLNQTLELRGKPDPHPTDDMKVLAQVRVLEVQVRGLGTLGSQVSVLSAGKQLVARRYIGGNIATGCRGPDAAIFALRRPGKYIVQVRYSDGHVVLADADLTGSTPKKLQMTREGAASMPAGPSSSSAPAGLPAGVWPASAAAGAPASAPADRPKP